MTVPMAAALIQHSDITIDTKKKEHRLLRNKQTATLPSRWHMRFMRTELT